MSFLKLLRVTSLQERRKQNKKNQKTKKKQTKKDHSSLRKEPVLKRGQ